MSKMQNFPFPSSLAMLLCACSVQSKNLPNSMTLSNSVIQRPTIVEAEGKAIDVDDCYPNRARAENIEALVTTQIYLTAQGRVIKVEVTKVQLAPKPINRGRQDLEKQFGDCAVRALERARFKPFEKDGQPRASMFLFDLRMRLR